MTTYRTFTTKFLLKDRLFYYHHHDHQTSCPAIWGQQISCYLQIANSFILLYHSYFITFIVLLPKNTCFFFNSFSLLSICACVPQKHFRALSNCPHIFSSLLNFIYYSGGSGSGRGGYGEKGTVTGKKCPKGLFGTFCNVCLIHWSLFVFILFITVFVLFSSWITVKYYM